KQRVQQKKVDTKGIRLSVRISNHDFNFRVEQARKFFKKGHKLKIDLILKGREKAHPEKAGEIINSFVNELMNFDDINIEKEQDLTKQGGRFTMILVNKQKKD
ncbi:translation initiation factor IF-3, partial [Candidatus Falkowbacteria bacterium]